MKKAHIILTEPDEQNPAATISLTYDERLLRRKKLVTDQGEAFVLDLEQTANLKCGNVIQWTDGTLVLIKAKEETLAKVTGDNLLELAWHIGNRHTPCQICGDHLLIQHDSIIEHMITHLGGKVTLVSEPFNPMGGAYGFGRTQPHEHGTTTHAHSH